MNSKHLSKLLLVFSFIGFLDASYLTLEHMLNRIPPCTIGGCETVLTSSYAAIFGIPIAAFGILYYMTVFFLVLQGKTSRVFYILVTLGFITSLVLLGIQAFVLNAFCLYCLGSLVTSTLLAGTALFLPRP